jgi:ribosomal protein S8
MNITINDFLKKEIKTYKSYKKLNQYEQGVLYGYEIALLVIERGAIKTSEGIHLRIEGETK